MENNQTDYHISFFKPTTESAKANRNLTQLLVVIWAVAVFGFQILLRILEKPVPEPPLAEFEEAWTPIQNGSESTLQLQQFAKANLYVLSKVFIAPDDKAVLDNALNYSVAKLCTPEQFIALKIRVKEFEQLKAEITDITDPVYVQTRNELGLHVAGIIDLASNDVRTTILPLELNSSMMESFTEENKAQLASVMEKYLIHYRSVLTDTKFLGFPFHYFYSAVFLLILFVGLCWIYCVRIDVLHSRLGVDDNM